MEKLRQAKRMLREADVFPEQIYDHGDKLLLAYTDEDSVHAASEVLDDLYAEYDLSLVDSDGIIALVVSAIL